MEQGKNPELVEKYFQPRANGEMDLVAAARQALIQAGMAESVPVFDADPNVIFATNKNSNVQRFKLNTWIDTQYLSTRRSVGTERSMILDNGSCENWMDIFIKYHIPMFKQLGLPQSYDKFVGQLTTAA